MTVSTRWSDTRRRVPAALSRGFVISLVVISLGMTAAAEQASRQQAEGLGIGIAPSPGLEAESLALAADLFDPVTLRPREDAVETIAALLEEIRTQDPRMREIVATPAPVTSVIVRLRESVPVCPVPEDVAAITRRFGGTVRARCQASLVPHVLVVIPDLRHVPSLVRLYTRAESVASAMNDELLGGSSWVVVEPDGANWRVVFIRGWGDCLAGCIHWEHHYFTVTPDGTVAKAGEWRRVDGRESGRQPWPLRRSRSHPD